MIDPMRRNKYQIAKSRAFGTWVIITPDPNSYSFANLTFGQALNILHYDMLFGRLGGEEAQRRYRNEVLRALTDPQRATRRTERV